MAQRPEVDVVIVGAGFGGIAALHAASARRYTALVLEAGSGPGGTWYWNRYPGARCDIESLQYSFSVFPAIAQDWNWTERYAAQPEILRYLEHVVEEQGMRPYMRFDTRVEAAHYDESAGRWRLRTKSGAGISARFCIMAAGTLSTTNAPAFPGIEQFKGKLYHTGLWPHEGVELRGKRVGVIGTGSSGIQAIPLIAAQAKHLTVFQRTPSYVMPARNRPLEPEEVEKTKTSYTELRRLWRKCPNLIAVNIGMQSAMEVDEETRRAVFEASWARGGTGFGSCFNDLFCNMESNAEVMKYFRWKIAQIVKDPKTADALTPTIPWGSRRPCFGTDYYETYNRPNVTLVNLLKAPIERFTENSLVVDGVEHELDIVVLATGFDAVTGTLLRMDVRGRNGLSLRDAWRNGPRTFLGMTIAGFPNLFMISGPQSPLTAINMATGSEMHAEWILDCFTWIDARGIKAIEASAEAERHWVEQTNAIGSRSLMSKGNSWWIGANIPGKPRAYVSYTDWLGYEARCLDVAARGYKEFIVEPASESQ